MAGVTHVGAPLQLTTTELAPTADTYFWDSTNKEMTQMAEMGFVIACSKFFGKLPGEGIREFAEEIRALTDQDCADLAPLLSDELGVTVTLP